MSGAGKRIAKALAPDGEWWKSGSGETVAEVAAEMIDRLIDEATTEDLLGRIIDAMRDEYGD